MHFHVSCWEGNSRIPHVFFNPAMSCMYAFAAAQGARTLHMGVDQFSPFGPKMTMGHFSRLVVIVRHPFWWFPQWSPHVSQICLINLHQSDCFKWPRRLGNTRCGHAPGNPGGHGPGGIKKPTASFGRIGQPDQFTWNLRLRGSWLI